MSKYRVVQVAPLYEPKCFRVDVFDPTIRTIDYTRMGAYTTAKDKNGWAFFNCFEEAQSFIVNNGDAVKVLPCVVKEYKILRKQEYA